MISCEQLQCNNLNALKGCFIQQFFEKGVWLDAEMMTEGVGKMAGAAETDGIRHLGNIQPTFFKKQPAMLQSLTAEIVECRGTVYFSESLIELGVSETHGA